MISSNFALPPEQLALINIWAAEPLAAACNKCGDEAFKEAHSGVAAELASVQRDLNRLKNFVPILSLQHPMGWIYDPIGVVTAQTVTGTGMFSDVTSAFTDLFGAQSGAYNAKLREGENVCKASLQAQTIEAGGNAVLAVDVDYAEVGGQRAMLMVCMTGTAVRIRECQSPLSEDISRLADAHQMAVRARLLQTALTKSANPYA